jgi:hypothetical protein
VTGFRPWVQQRDHPATVNPPASVPKWEIVALEDNAIAMKG